MKKEDCGYFGHYLHQLQIKKEMDAAMVEWPEIIQHFSCSVMSTAIYTARTAVW